MMYCTALKDAILILDEGLRRAKDIGDDFLFAEGLLHRAQAYIHQGLYDLAKRDLERLLKMPEATFKLSILRYLTYIAVSQSDITTALDYGHQALNTARHLNARVDDDLVYLARTYLLISDTAKAKVLLDEAFLSFGDAVESNQHSGYAFCVRELGNVSFSEADNQSAMAYYSRGLEFFRKTGETSGEAFVMISVCGVYLVQNDIDEARTCALTILALQRATQLFEDMPQAFCYLAEVFFSDKEFSASAAVTEVALNMARRMGARRIIANCLVQLGHLRAEESKRHQAAKFYLEALEIYSSGSDKRGAERCLIFIAAATRG
jgi:tetratricopeptide (TPR) repeat protein